MRSFFIHVNIYVFVKTVINSKKLKIVLIVNKNIQKLIDFMLIKLK